MPHVYEPLNLRGNKLTGVPTATDPSDAVPLSQMGLGATLGRFRSGFYSLIGNAVISTSNTMGNGSLRMYAFLVPSAITVTAIGAEITVAGDVGSKLRLGIYADDGNGFPAARVVDAGTIAGDSATVQEVVCNVALTPGIYWIGGALQDVVTTQPTIRTIGSPVLPIQVASISIPAANQSVTGVNIGGVTGAFPSSVTPTAANSGNAPRCFIKVA